MKAVIYARYSSDNQREESIEGQLRECMEYADYNDNVICVVRKRWVEIVISTLSSGQKPRRAYWAKSILV